MAVRASSEQADRWPAHKAVDGVTDEPEGIWQTLRNSPKSAWLELLLSRKRRIRGVRVFHQNNPRYYRSVDYTIACQTASGLRKVAQVRGNRKAGWREHAFEPLETTKVRIEITKSEYGYRMGLSEVQLVYADAATTTPQPRVVTTEPHHIGKVGDMGLIALTVRRPRGARVEIATRTARDAGGKPASWADWSAPYTRSPARITSPPGEWVQCRGVFHDTPTARAVVEEITLGSPHCLGRVDFGALIAPPGEPLTVSVLFGRPMDRRSRLAGEIALSDGAAQALRGGAWDQAGRVWRFKPARLGGQAGLARVVFGGARTPEGARMMHHATAVAVGRNVLLDKLRALADWMMKNPGKAIFVEGYNQRTILALHEITGEKRYLDHVRKWAKWLLAYQRPQGYWPTGYGDVYFADTGSALGLLINFYKHATAEETKAIDRALARYVDLLLVRGDSKGRPFVHADGSLGVGYRADKGGNVTSDLNQPYTISTALTGAEIFAALYYMTGKTSHKDVAVKACDWLLGTMAPSGQIPYYIDDWNPGRKDQHWIWRRWPYDTAAYVGEGLIAAWTYLDDDTFRERLGRRIQPHVEWLLRTQNADGSWAEKGSGDQLRSHGVVNFLLWYHRRFGGDPRILHAVRRWYVLLLDAERGAYLRVPGNGIATSLAGRALVDIVQPDADCRRWKTPKP